VGCWVFFLYQANTNYLVVDNYRIQFLHPLSIKAACPILCHDFPLQSKPSRLFVAAKAISGFLQTEFILFLSFQKCNRQVKSTSIHCIYRHTLSWKLFWYIYICNGFLLHNTVMSKCIYHLIDTFSTSQYRSMWWQRATFQHFVAFSHLF
jgi:hypothetical protein